MICRTCGIEGHDSQGKKELCLVAVVARCKRHEALLLETAKELDRWKKAYQPDATLKGSAMADRIRDALNDGKADNG